VERLLEEARIGKHKFCKNCPWNPIIVGPIAFGVSCKEHGIDWSSNDKAISIQIVQDPAGTTPEITGRLCFVHNSKNPTDKTAKHAYDLWNAAVSFDIEGDIDPYLKKHYWTNALLHGADKKNQNLRKSKVLEAARKCCAQLLHAQIIQLSPSVIISNGEYAANSLAYIGLLSKQWGELKQNFDNGVYTENNKLPSGKEVKVFSTYHTAITPINTIIAGLYTQRLQIMLDEKLREYIHYPKVRSFLNKYQPLSPEGRGMRVMLLHWLDIGTAIRGY